jgi:hypothetical protein
MERPDDDSKNLLAQYVSKNEFVLEDAFHPVYIYRHIRSGLPVACIAGGHQGHIIGGIVYFRSSDDSMNMEVEAPMDQMRLTMSFTAKMLSETVIPGDGVEGVWRRFMNNLLQHLAGKRGFTADGVPLPVLPQLQEEREREEREREPPAEVKQEELQSEQPEQKVAKVESPAPTECMICLEATPDTTVTPCLHQVVCAACSVSLESTADAKVCCQCRCPIDGVFYPDNTMKEIKK